MINDNFYPTPINIIQKMIDGLKFEKIKTILEPSAGKGDICDYITSREYRDSKDDFDTIEIEEDLRSILKEKGYNVIYDDFLEFETLKRYDLIIANFPFSDGDKHLYKAISIIKKNGGNLICLVNAETIKNPFSNLRKTIKTELDDLGASVEFIKDGFSQAERKTNVEVALIKLEKEKTEARILLDSLKKSEEYKSDSEINKAVIEKDFVKSIIARFNFEAKAGIRLIEEYEALKPLLLDSVRSEYKSPIIKIEVKGSGSRDNVSENINLYLKNLRRKYWEIFLENPDIRRKYTSNILSDISSKLNDLMNYDFNLRNIIELEKELGSKVSLWIEEMIMKMFDEFSYQHSYSDEFGKNIHYFNGWKTNKAWKINEKVILPIMGYSYYSFDKDKLETYRLSEKMNDIVKVFNYLEGEVENVPALVGREVEYANNTGCARNIDFHYFTATFYKKGTCHIKFNNKALLDKFNIFGSQRKGWLPPSYGKKKYGDMSQDEKQVVDEFQGLEEYEKVCQNKDYYIVEKIGVKLLN